MQPTYLCARVPLVYVAACAVRYGYMALLALFVPSISMARLLNPFRAPKTPPYTIFKQFFPKNGFRAVSKCVNRKSSKGRYCCFVKSLFIYYTIPVVHRLCLRFHLVDGSWVRFPSTSSLYFMGVRAGRHYE